MEIKCVDANLACASTIMYHKGVVKMDCKDILNLAAIIIIPIFAVLIGQWLQDRSERRKDKMQIFKTLMTYHAT